MVSRQYRRSVLFLVVAAAALPVGQARANTQAERQPTATLAARHRPRLDVGSLRLKDIPPVAPMRLADTVITTPAPTVPAEEPRREVRTDVVETHHNYMATMALSAIMGGVLGAVVGVAVYYIDNGERARNIAYWAAGGVLLGAGVGLVEVIVEESRTSAAMSNAPTDPAPTLRLALYHGRF